MSLQELESYSVMSVRHKVTNLHNVHPLAVIHAVDQSQRTAPSDQSQTHGKAGFRETSHETFTNH